jgi:hypothetical protein
MRAGSVIAATIVLACAGYYFAFQRKLPTTTNPVAPLDFKRLVAGAPVLGGPGWNGPRDLTLFPADLQTAEIQQIYEALGQLQGVTQSVEHVEMPWRDVPFALRIRLGNAFVFCIKNDSNQWEARKVIPIVKATSRQTNVVAQTDDSLVEEMAHATSAIPLTQNDLYHLRVAISDHGGPPLVLPDPIDSITCRPCQLADDDLASLAAACQSQGIQPREHLGSVNPLLVGTNYVAKVVFVTNPYQSRETYFWKSAEGQWHSIGGLTRRR